jgi:UTP-glucose-1-phosphate uridylyltransferase
MENLETDANDALRLADVFRHLIGKREPVYGWEFTGKRLDCGTLEGFCEAERELRKHEVRNGKSAKKRQ